MQSNTSIKSSYGHRFTSLPVTTSKTDGCYIAPPVTDTTSQFSKQNRNGSFGRPSCILPSTDPDVYVFEKNDGSPSLFWRPKEIIQEISCSPFLTVLHSDKDERKTSELEAEVFASRLLRIMTGENYVSGEASPSEEFVEQTFQVQGVEWTINQLECICEENSGSPHVLIGILHMLSHFSYETVKPAGLRLAEKLLHHESKSVREFAVKAFENWEAEETVTILESIIYDEIWLQEYLNTVIAELKRN